jgi:hypothetical protein
MQTSVFRAQLIEILELRLFSEMEKLEKPDMAMYLTIGAFQHCKTSVLRAFMDVDNGFWVEQAKRLQKHFIDSVINADDDPEDF